MRDLERYVTYAGPNNSAQLLKDDDDPRRQEYLAKFADREGTTFLLKFWKKYQKKTPRRAWKPFSTACTQRLSAWPPSTATCFPKPTRTPSTALCAHTW